jgi:hypothetical protein
VEFAAIMAMDENEEAQQQKQDRKEHNACDEQVLRARFCF